MILLKKYSKMKRIFIMSYFLIAFFLLGKAQDTTSQVEVGDQMPAFTIALDGGAEIVSSQFEGKVILIAFFATWCPPCQQELAEFEKVLWPTYKDNKDFALVVIGREHSEAELIKYNEKKGFTFPLYPDKNRKIYDAFASKFIPRTYLIDKSGKIVFKTQGFNEKEFTRIQRVIDNALM